MFKQIFEKKVNFSVYVTTEEEALKHIKAIILYENSPVASTQNGTFWRGLVIESLEKENAGKAIVVPPVSIAEKAKYNKICSEVRKWFSEDIVGKEAKDLLGKYPPYISVLTRDTFSKVVDSSSTFGKYREGTNNILLPAGLPEHKIYYAMAHELMHYCAFLVNGKNANSGVQLIDEILTENMARKVLQKNAPEVYKKMLAEVEGSGYQLPSLYLDDLIGDEALTKTFFDGNYDRLKKAINKFGKETWKDLEATDEMSDQSHIIKELIKAKRYGTTRPTKKENEQILKKMEEEGFEP